jgi:transcriptional regulator with XRE-family HTH domain
MAGQLSLFGPELRRRRLDAGLSLAQLAEQIHYSKSYLSKVETGLKPPGASLARQCDAALGANGALSALVGRAELAQPVALDRADGEVWVMSVAADGTGVFQPMNRRDVLALGATSFLGVGATRRGMSAAARDESTLRTFRSLFDHSRRLGQIASPGVVLPNVIALAQTLRGMAGAANAATREGLLLLAGRCAEYAGWMAQEAGNDNSATWWTYSATELATAAGDADLAAYTLVRRAEIALYRDDAAGTIALAQQAQGSPGTAARVRGLAAQREAQGHAIAGDYDRCRHLLDRSAALLGAAGPQSSGLAGPPVASPPLGSSTVPNLDEVVAAWCLHDLGRPRDAAEAMDRAITRIPPTAARARARFGVRHALAYADAGEIEHACTLTDDLLGTVEQVDSATIRLDLRRLAHTLARWHAHQSVRDLYPRLTATLHRSDE